MSDEEIKEEIEQVGYKEFYRYYQEKDTLIKKQKQEIKRLNKRIEDLNIINEGHRILNGMIRKQLQQKENIIKEAREYAKSNYKYYTGVNDVSLARKQVHKEYLAILDKENK